MLNLRIFAETWSSTAYKVIVHDSRPPPHGGRLGYGHQLREVRRNGAVPEVPRERTQGLLLEDAAADRS
jgi:hypothetical protein